MLKKFFLGPPAITKVSEQITTQVTNSTIRFLESGQILDMLDFKQSKQKEKDRIFNELLLSGIAMSVLMAELLARFAEDEKQEFLKNLKNDLPHGYIRILQNLEVEKKYLNLWDKLINARCDELRKDWGEHRHLFPDALHGNPWVPVAATSAFAHIRLEKMFLDDPFFKTLGGWFSDMSDFIEKIIIKNLKRV